LGYAAGASVSLTFGTPAHEVDISASLTDKREHLFLAWRLHCCRAQRRTVCCYPIFVVRRSEEAEIHRRILLQDGASCLAQRKVYEWVE
jgi:hypothetical protein